METLSLTPWISAAGYIAAAMIVYLVALNRRLLLLTGSGFKKPVIVIVFFVLLSASGLLGYHLGGTNWCYLPLVIFGIAILGEAQQQLLRRRYRGSEPTFGDRSTILTQPITTTDLRVLHYEVEIPQLEAESFRVVHLSDLHVTDELPEDYYKDVMAQVNHHKPDFVFITGDFVTDSAFIPNLAEIIKIPKARHGVYAVLGNHDYWADPTAISDTVRSAGVVLLDDDHRRVAINERVAVVVYGYDAPWKESALTLPAFKDGEIVLALSHIADNVYDLNRNAAKAVFSGHNHGGQFRLPLVGPIIVPSKFGRRFDRGHYVVDGTHLFISAGVGGSRPSLRIFCPPDIFVIKFVGSQQSPPYHK